MSENIIEEILDEEIEPHKNHSIKEENKNIKPHFASFMFLWSPALSFLAILIVISLLSWAIFSWDNVNWEVIWMISFVPTLILWVLFVLWFLWRLVKYKKEKYTITDRKVIYKNWNLFTDNEVEISLDRVVQVKSILWFVQNLIFKTWNIQIKTAWSSDSTVYFRNISESLKIYEEIKDRMKKNGFNLKMDKLVQLEKPHWLAIVWEVFGKVLGWILFLAYLAYSFYIWMKEEWFEYWEMAWEYWDSVSTGVIWFWTVVIVIIWVFALFKYLDLKQRQYKIFTDTITYNEWFLTKNHSFLPLEKVSDTENTQSFFSKIFGLHDVVVSSEWNNNKVNFKNMVNWEKMMANIKHLKDETILWEKDLIEWEEKKENSLIWFKSTMEDALDYDKEYEDTFVISKWKTLFPLLILLIPPFTPAFFVIWIYSLIQIFATKFIISKSAIEKRFEFINTKHNSFSVEKITWVVIRESLIDKLFKTCSVKFWSIGNWSDITFKNIKKTPDLEEKILSKLWIKKDNLTKNIESKLNFSDYIKSSIWTFIAISSLYIFSIIIWFFIPEIEKSWVLIINTMILVLILFLVLLRYFYTKFYYSPVRYINKVYSDCIESIQWFFIVSKKYSLFRNVKGTKSKKYPLTETGTLTFDIAWEQVQEQKWWRQNGIIFLINLISWKWNWSTIVVSNKISMKFIKNVFDTFEETETLLNKEEVEKESIASSTQDIWNSIFVYVIILITISVWISFSWELIAFLVLIPLLIIIWVIIWSIKVRFYDYQKDRILFSSWIIYKQKHSILYKKFNYVEFNKWFVNKIFKNWNIKIYTLWSWSIDLLIKDIANYREVYELFKKD